MGTTNYNCVRLPYACCNLFKFCRIFQFGYDVFLGSCLSYKAEKNKKKNEIDTKNSSYFYRVCVIGYVNIM